MNGIHEGKPNEQGDIENHSRIMLLEGCHY